MFVTGEWDERMVMDNASQVFGKMAFDHCSLVICSTRSNLGDLFLVSWVKHSPNWELQYICI